MQQPFRIKKGSSDSREPRPVLSASKNRQSQTLPRQLPALTPDPIHKSFQLDPKTPQNLTINNSQKIPRVVTANQPKKYFGIFSKTYPVLLFSFWRQFNFFFFQN